MPILGSFVALPLETVKKLSEYALRKRLDVLPCEVLSKEKMRTNKQNRAIHKYCDNLAAELNGVGATIGVEILTMKRQPFDMMLVKEHIWRPVQIALTGKKSTTKLNTIEVSQVYEKIDRLFFHQYGFAVPFDK